jgi:hypothetical protein
MSTLAAILTLLLQAPASTAPPVNRDAQRSADPTAPVKVPPVKLVTFDELIRAVKAQKGKVVVVDFWDDG